MAFSKKLKKAVNNAQEREPALALKGQAHDINTTTYETDEERLKRYEREEAGIRKHIDSWRGDKDYDTAFKEWEARDIEASRKQAEIDSGWRLSVVGRKGDKGTVIKADTLTGMSKDEAREKGYILAEEKTMQQLFQEKTGEAWNAFQEGNEDLRRDDFQFYKGVRDKGRTTAMKDKDGNYLRYNEKGEFDPEGEYYLHARHDKRKSGAVQWVDKALGTDIESLLDNDLMGVVGTALDAYSFGTATQIIGGDEYVQSSREAMNDLTNDNWDEINAVGHAVADTVAAAVSGGAWVAIMAARTLAQGIANEAMGREYDWEGAVTGLGASIAGSFIGGHAANAVGAAKGGAAAGAIKGASSNAIAQGLSGESFDVGELAIASGVGAVSSFATPNNKQFDPGDAMALIAQMGQQALKAYQAGEISRDEYERQKAEIEKQQAEANRIYMANTTQNAVSSFRGGGAAPAPAGAGGGVNTGNATNPFRRR